MKIYVTVNAGVLVSGAGASVLVDSVFTYGNGFFSVPDKKLLGDIAACRTPFDHLSAFVFTHTHRDHCDLDEMKNVAGTDIPILMPYSNPGVEFRADISAPVMLFGEGKRDIESVDFAGIQIDAIPTVHDGGARYAIEHYSYLITVDGKQIFVMGDASPEDELLSARLSERRIDVACMNFTELHRDAGRKFIHDAVKPAKLILYHLPFEKDDNHCLRSSCAKDVKKYGDEFPDLTVALEPMVCCCAV